MIALLLLLAAQSLDVSPSHVDIPPGQKTLEAWPDFEADPAVGYRTFTITYTIGPAGIVAGGAVQIGMGYKTADTTNPAYAINHGWLLGPTASMNRFPCGRFQATTPAAANYTTAACAKSSLAVQTIEHDLHGREVLIEARPTNALAAGDEIVFVFGDTSAGGPGATISWCPGWPGLVAFVDDDADGTFVESPTNHARILFSGSRIDRLIVNFPVVARVGEAVQFGVRAMQGMDSPTEDPFVPVESATGTVRFTSTDRFVSIPPPPPFTKSDRGALLLSATFGTPGVQLVRARLATIGNQGEQASISSLSNALLVLPADSDLEVACGDLQRHAAPGGHSSLTDYLCWRELYLNACNFGCVVQHSQHRMSGFSHANAEALRFQSAWDPFEARFVAFPGYEWTLKGSHRHVVYQRFTSDRSLAEGRYAGFEVPGPEVVTTTQAFLDRLESMPSDSPKIAIPHHTLWNGTSFDFPDQPFEWGAELDDPEQPLVEIFSDHGSSETWLDQASAPEDYPIGGDLAHQREADNESSVRDAIRKGHRFGFVGSSDRHNYTAWTTNDNGEYARQGLGFARCTRSIPALRERYWEALTARRTYATTGARIYLDWVAIDGTPMGGESVLPVATFALEVHASGVALDVRPTVTRWEVVRDGDPVHVEGCTDSDVIAAWTDPAPLQDGRPHAYYVKVVQSDAHVAWSSPIWVTVP